MTTTTFDLTSDASARTPETARASFSVAAPKFLLRVEGLIMGIAAVMGYGALGGSWGLFAALLLVPDVSMLGYLAGRRVGAAMYNAGHHLVGPSLVAGIGALTGTPDAYLYALIWVAHIGLDRALGYGLKYPTAFRDTHLS